MTENPIAVPRGKLNIARRILSAKAGKFGVIAMLSASAIALSAPTSGAANQKSWVDGCRGYWYSTSGHAYCYNATRGVNGYDVFYDCNVETDTWHYKKATFGFEGKISTHECTFKVNSTRVS
ncbi:hypothetical protein [Streptomyces formicae]|uniref:Secreted protein n=1 Tax=Streptomyces formicae TaxID=1616117 RepID=A0ABY3WH80_9ACTN|nr:hypothetical protein [Streptomyces formicae]UNM11943.1 hypothetical protein J4032_10660 [Streptomyces formicae]